MQFCSSAARSSSHELRMYSCHATTPRTSPAQTQLAYSLCRVELRRWTSGGLEGAPAVRIGFPGYRLRRCGQHHGSGGAPSALGRRSGRLPPAPTARMQPVPSRKPEKQDERRVRGCPGSFRAAGSGCVHSTTASAAHQALRAGQVQLARRTRTCDTAHRGARHSVPALVC
jgi:hypothetical protein